MKITNVRVEVTSREKDHPVRDALQLLDRDGVTTVTIGTDDGVSGVSTPGADTVRGVGNAEPDC